MIAPQPDLSLIFGKNAPIIKKGWAEIERLKQEKDQLKWYQFLKRREYNNTIWEVQQCLMGIGMQKAIDDLEKWGLIKINKKDKLCQQKTDN